MSTQSKETANSNKVANSQKDKGQNVGAILSQSQKDKTGTSAYGATVNAICADLSLLSDRSRLLKKLEEQGIDVKASKNAVQTGYSQTRKIISELHINGYLR